MNNFSRAPNKKNSIKPGSRPLISLAPTIILLNEDPFLIIGGSGGERSIITMVQFIVNIIENNLSPEEAMFAPRFCYNYLDDTIEMESRIDSESIDYLKSVGYKIKLMNSYDIYFGNIQAVWYDMSNGQYQANSDVRQEEVVFFR
jgi:gamma-glutamyltranspeptidase/glutathione hydrolase